jgi:hypothetical protein
MIFKAHFFYFDLLKVLSRGLQLFFKIATILEHLRNKKESFSAYVKELHRVKEMLDREKADFEVYLLTRI